MRKPRKVYSAQQRRDWNITTRYGLKPAEYKAMLDRQGGVCACCGGLMERPVVDHCHSSGKVRGIICHPCNIKLPVIEDMGWVMLAWAYLDGEQ